MTPTPPKVTAAHRKHAEGVVRGLWPTTRSNEPQNIDIIAQALAAAESRSAPSRADGWVSVEERLPEMGHPVLVHTARHGVREGFRGSGKMWFFADGDECGRAITHWQPLPQPPESR